MRDNPWSTRGLAGRIRIVQIRTPEPQTGTGVEARVVNSFRTTMEKIGVHPIAAGGSPQGPGRPHPPLVEPPGRT